MSKKNKATNQQKLLSPANYIKTRARNLPIHECFINHDWDDSKMANVFIARKHSNGNKTFSFYLVDLFCLGVKNSFFRFNETDYEYNEIKSKFLDDGFIAIDYVLAHNIIFSGVEFAAEFGINACKDFQELTRFILDEDNDNVELIEIECGYNDKPMLIVGPHNKIELQKTIAHLEKKVGSNGFLVREVSGDEDEYEENNNPGHDFHIMQIIDELAYNEDDEHFQDWLKNDIDKFNTTIANFNIKMPNSNEKVEFIHLLETLFVNLHGFKAIENCYNNLQKALNFSLSEDDVPDRIIFGTQKLLPATIENYKTEINKFMSTSFKSQKEEFKAVEKLAKKYPQILFFQLLRFDCLFIIGTHKEIKVCMANISAIDPTYWLFDIMKQLIQFDGSHKIEAFERILNGENLVDVFALNFDIIFEELVLFYTMFFKYLVVTENVLALNLFVKAEYIPILNDLDTVMNVEGVLITAKTDWILKRLGA